MSSPLYGPVPIIPRKSTGVADSVALKKSDKEETVLAAGKKPSRKMLNELKNENDSKFAPRVMACLPRNRVKLSVSCHTSWSRMLWIENGSWPTVAYVTPASPISIVGKAGPNGCRKARQRLQLAKRRVAKALARP